MNRPLLRWEIVIVKHELKFNLSLDNEKSLPTKNDYERNLVENDTIKNRIEYTSTRNDSTFTKSIKICTLNGFKL